MQEPVIKVSEVQGNIMPGFGKPHQYFIGYKIRDAGAVKPWLKSISGDITTAEEVNLFRKLRALMTRQSGDKPRPEQLSAVWLNIAFSAGGLRLLAGAGEVEKFGDIAFQLGLHERSEFIGDPTNQQNVEGSRKNWRVGGSEASTPEIFFIVAGDDPDHVLKEKDRLRENAEGLTGGNGKALEFIYQEGGANLPGELAGHEHFGFKDGISQPGLRGRWSNAPEEFLSPRLFAGDDPRSIEFAKPGQPLIWPGEFLFGYNRQDGLVPTSSQPPWEAPEWARNGSFLVFRRLRQDVALFWAFINEQQQELSTRPGFEAIEATELASLLVGRWPSGAPVMRTPGADRGELAKLPQANHFRFDQASLAVKYATGSGLPDDTGHLAPGDHNGFICPHASHIRKVNPRDITTDQGSSTDTRRRRILRRGIPFGPVLKDRSGQEPDPVDGNRGLMFLSYQTSIREQFEFLTTKWMNETDGPEENPGGHDVLVGRTGGTRTSTLRRRVNGDEFEENLQTDLDWIIPTGGAYFFSPSISALRDVLGAS